MDLAQQAGSGIWRRLSAALLATVHLAQGEPQKADAVLAAVAGMEGTEYTLMGRTCRLARARLELMADKPARALQVVDDLIATTPNVERVGIQHLPRLLLVRAEALMALGKGMEAETVLQTAQAGAGVQGAAPLQWRILAQLATLYQSQGRHVEAAATTETARVLIEQVAGTIPEEGVRVLLIERAKRRLGIVAPRRRGRAAPSAGGFKSGGLTAREVEIAKLITQGRSNREIAARLLITERTVTTHISHIFNRLGFITRTQIAAWVAGQGWNEPDKSSD